MTVPARLVPLVHAAADVFERLKLDHAVGGALANNYWGVVRATQDLDVLVLLPALRYQELADALTAAGFQSPLPDGATAPIDVPQWVATVRDRHLFVVCRDGIKVEVFVPRFPLQHEILRRAVRLPFEGRTIRVTSAEDLVVLKMVFHRDKDLRDIRGILATQKGKLDLAYVRRWATQMVEDSRLAELEGWIRDYA